MRLSRTTLSGAAAGVSFAAAQTPGLPHWLAVAFNFGAALGMLSLGRFSTDCPLNCPGTDEDGNPRQRGRQLKLPVVWPAVALIVALGVVSCVAPNPAAGPDNPSAPAYVVSPTLTTVSNQVHHVAAAVDQVTGLPGLGQVLAAAGFAVAAGISGYVARRRSQTARAMADALVYAGPGAVQRAKDRSAHTPARLAVAREIQKARDRQFRDPGNSPVDTTADKS